LVLPCGLVNLMGRVLKVIQIIPLILVSALASAAVMPVASAQADVPALRFSAIDLSKPDWANFVLTLPPGVSSRPLPEAAFSASQGGRALPTHAQRLVDGKLELVLALDNSVSPSNLMAEQSAAVDLLRSLPLTLRTTILPGGRTSTDLAGLSQLSRFHAGSLDQFGSLPPAILYRRSFVVIAGCSKLPRIQHMVNRNHLSVLAMGAPCQRAARALAASDPGVVRTGLTSQQLFAGIDEVSRDLLDEYQVQVMVGSRGGPLTVRVNAQQTLQGTLALSGSPKKTKLDGRQSLPSAGTADQKTSGQLLVLACVWVMAGLAVTVCVLRR